MTGNRTLFVAGIFAQLLVLSLFIPATKQMLSKADLPVSLVNETEKLVIADPAFEKTTTVLAVNSISVHEREEVEIICDFFKPGDHISLFLLTGDKITTKNYILVPFYSLFHVVVQVIIALIFILIGNFVVIKKPGNLHAQLFFLCCFGVAAIVITTWGSAKVDIPLLADVTRAIFHLSYVVTPVFFIHFALVYPANRMKDPGYLLFLLYFFAFAVSFGNFISYLSVKTSLTQETLSAYIDWFNISRTATVVLVIASTSIFINSYRKSTTREDKQRLLWLITGYFIGPFAFVLLWVIPQGLTGSGIIPESVVSMLMLSIPVCFTISIVKYHFLDIQLILNRSIVYTSVVSILSAIYFVLLFLVSTYITRDFELEFATVTTLILAFFFQPLKTRVQVVVNKNFFMVHYNFKEMVVQFRNLLESAITVKEIGICLGDFILKNIPYKFFAISLLQENSSPRLLYQNSDSQFTFPENVRLEEKIYARRDALEQGINFEDISPLPFGDEVKVIINENAHTANFHAVVLLGEKKSEFKTSRDDIDFIETLAKSAIDAIEAASLKESLIRKELEAEKLAELNEQKSLFVSSVSHDLKTPLTSINLLAQQMRRKKNIPEDKVNHYLDVITGETERLTRLIDNVLHFSQMERGVKQFVMAPLILNDSLQNSLDLMKYQIKSEGFKLNTSISERKIRINGNHDALVECLINLFSNALKFGKPNNLIDVSLVSSGSEACITVRDFGIGMEEGEIKEIFNPFYRTGVSTAKKIPGTGLGLTIVKNIVDAHQGKIEVTSKPGEGTIIKLFFKECYEENSPD